MRHLAARQFSSEFANMQKRIFSSPLQDWMRNSEGLHRAFLSLASNEALINDHMDSRRITELVEQFKADGSSRSPSRDLGNMLFSLLGLEIWLQRFART